MQLPKIDVQQQRLPSLLNDISEGRLQIPRFQRDYVWPVTKTRALLDSMYKEFPIGTFFLWRAPANTPPISRPLLELGIPAPRESDAITYILDGQQRLTSLYVAIKGTKLGSRNYGRICIDLQAADAYEDAVEEGFSEDIFVYRASDDSRYIAVRDLVGDKALLLFEGVPQQLRKVYQKAHSLFQTYPFSVVSIQEQTLWSAIDIFQRINQSGKRLSRYDLVCANVWTETFDFRKRVADTNKKFEDQGFGQIDETIFTQTFALILKNQCTTLAELSLESELIQETWPKVIRAMEVAIEFVTTNLGVVRSDYLPYRGLLAVLAFYFFHRHSSAISAKERQTLCRWFWRVTLSERYSSTTPSKMAEDARKLRAVRDGGDVEFDYPSKVTEETIVRTKMTSTSSALRNAAICMMALRQPLNLKDGSPVRLEDRFFSNLKKAERHHVFPVGYLRTAGVPTSRVHLLPNFCFIPADLNKQIGSRAPAEYLAELQESNPELIRAAESHLLSINSPAIQKNDYEGFLRERANVISRSLNDLLEGIPIAGAGATLPPDHIDVMEIRLRDFIDDRLRGIGGPAYWKSSAPGDVVTKVKERIHEHVTRHPYEDEEAFGSGRRRLDFCDPGDYEKIILKNWEQFTEYFQRKDEFQRHMSAYRTLRNCVQHNRQATQVEQKTGDAAMLWLGEIIDRYDIERGESDSEVADEEEVIE